MQKIGSIKGMCSSCLQSGCLPLTSPHTVRPRQVLTLYNNNVGKDVGPKGKTKVNWADAT